MNDLNRRMAKLMGYESDVHWNPARANRMELFDPVHNTADAFKVDEKMSETHRLTLTRYSNCWNALYQPVKSCVISGEGHAATAALAICLAADKIDKEIEAQ